jgi:peptidoglycan/xylan/chitin deacetylase (PgdA/CDA1 family)
MKLPFAHMNAKLKSTFKKSALIVMALDILAGVAFSAIPTATVHAASQTATGQVTLTFDDGLSSAYTYAAPILAQYRLTATEYVPTGCIGTGVVCESNDASNVMSWQQIQALQNTYGWEIGSHTVTTPCLANDCAGVPTVTATQIDSELADSQQTLIKEGINNPLAFAFPFGDYNNAALAEVDKYYTNARGFQDVGYNTFPYNGTLVVDQQVQGSVTVAQVESYINTAKANNQWLVLSFHDIQPNASLIDADYQWSTADLTQIAAYLKAQNTPVVTSTGGLPTSSTNMFTNGCFTGGIADGWTTDNTANIKADQEAAATTAGGNFSAINGHGSYCNGSAQSALDSVYLSNTSSTDSHLFSPTVAVTSGTTYILNNFVNVTSGAGEVDFIVDEYNASGAWISDQYHTGIVGTTTANAIQVGNVNFTYTPTSSTVASVRLQVIAHGTTLTGYYDNAQMYPESAVNTTTPPLLTGDINGDGTVDALDLSILLSNWGKTGATGTQGDLNGDGTVDALDLSILLSHWSK